MGWLFQTRSLTWWGPWLGQQDRVLPHRSYDAVGSAGYVLMVKAEEEKYVEVFVGTASFL